MALTEEATDRALKQLSKRMGQVSASNLLSALGRNKQFINALETPIGQELMKDAVQCIEDVISLVLQEKDTPQDRAELKAYLKIMGKWQKTIIQYNKDRTQFDKASI